MKHQNSKLYSLILIIADALVLTLAFVISYVVRVQYDPRPLVSNIYAFDYLFSFLSIVPFWIIVFALIGLYNPNTYTKRFLEWSKVGVGVFIGILLIIGWEFISEKEFFPARLVALYALIGSFILVIVEREILRLVRTLLFRYGKLISRVLVIGNSDTAADIAIALADTAKSGYQIIAIAVPKKNFPNSFQAKHYSTPELALKDLKLNQITHIIQTDLYEDDERNRKILAASQDLHINYSFVPSESEFYSGKNTVDVFLGYPMINVYQTPLIGWGAIVKRMFDVIVSLLLIIILSPLFLVVIIFQKILNPGTIFYYNHRLSRFSEKFDLIKFRTMRHIKGFDGKLINDAAEFRAMGREDLALEYEKNHKVSDDPRVNGWSRLLRRSSIDELPQLFNVLRGDLSLVGPRPILPTEVSNIRGRASILHSVKSGVTGLWQVSGRSELDFDERIDLELWYAQNWTFWLDVKILFKTFGVVLGRRGAK